MGKRKKEIRSNFRKDVFERDNYTCQVCGETRLAEVLDAHHVTDRSLMPNGGYVKENGITVCQEDIEEGHKLTCHMRVEQFHISNGENWEEGLHPVDLYTIIGSSEEIAISSSVRL
jgi:5-methylcytosine-specific restriction endonuclease McrA